MKSRLHDENCFSRKYSILQEVDGIILFDLALERKSGSSYISLTNSFQVETIVASDARPETWFHVGVVLSPGTARLFVDGSNVGGNVAWNANASWPPLIDGTLAVGDTFDGFLQDVRIYTRPLSSADVGRLAAGAETLSGAALHKECLCTDSHPIVSGDDDSLCADGSSTIARLNENAFYPEFINDDDLTTVWRARVNATEANVTLRFSEIVNVTAVDVYFASSTPRALGIFLSPDGGQTWRALQYISENCTKWFSRYVTCLRWYCQLK